MDYLVIILLSLLMSAFFSGMEIAFLSVNRLRIELDKKQGKFSSKVISVFTSNPNEYIATMLVGYYIALVIYGLIMAIVLEPVISQITQSEGTILFLQTIVSAIIILITAEVLPKTLIRINPHFVLSFFSVPIFIFYIIFYPVTKITIFIAQSFIRTIFRKDVPRKPEKIVFSKMDLDHLVSEGQTDTLLRDEKDREIKIFQNALAFSTLKVRDCMIPRTDIVALGINSSLEEVKQTFINTGLSKVLIYERDIDDIIGYLTHKELFTNPEDIRSRLHDISFVPETMSARNLLKEFITQQKSIAVVVDEFGGVSGMLTIEDIIEEIFGDIKDEHDLVERYEQKLSDREYIFSGRLEIEYINEKYQLNLPESDEYDTVAGLIIFYSEKLPTINEHIEVNQFRFKILKVTQTRIELVGMELIG
ncbi:MAG: hemolysin family protein [Bacteroidota bacterium]